MRESKTTWKLNTDYKPDHKNRITYLKFDDRQA